MQFIQAEGDSVEEARQQAQSKIPEGHYWFSETIHEPPIEESTAAQLTIEDAFDMAEAQMDSQSIMVKKEVLTNPEEKVFQVEALNEDEARQKAKPLAESLDSDAAVAAIRLVTAGRKGLLGLGKKPGVYEATIIKPAHVRIEYRTGRTKIEVTVKTIKEFIYDLFVDQNCERARQVLIQVGEPVIPLLLNEMLNRAATMESYGRAAKLLDVLGWQPGTDEASAIYHISKGQWIECVKIGEPAINQLGRLFTVDTYLDRAVEAIVQIGGPKAVEMLVSRFYKPVTKTQRIERNAEMEGLLKISQPDLVAVRERLQRGFQSKDEQERMISAYALGRLGDAQMMDCYQEWIESLTDYNLVTQYIKGIILGEEPQRVTLWYERMRQSQEPDPIQTPVHEHSWEMEDENYCVCRSCGLRLPHSFSTGTVHGRDDDVHVEYTSTITACIHCGYVKSSDPSDVRYTDW